MLKLGVYPCSFMFKHKTNAVFTQRTVMIDVDWVWTKHWSWFLFFFFFLLPLLSVLIFPSVFPSLSSCPTPFLNHHHSFLSHALHLNPFTGWFPVSLLSVTVHQFLSHSINVCPSLALWLPPFRVCECVCLGGPPSNRTGELVVQLQTGRRGNSQKHLAANTLPPRGKHHLQGWCSE